MKFWKVSLPVISLKPKLLRMIIVNMRSLVISRNVIPVMKTLVTDVDGNDDYWTFIENPIYETFENIFENPIYDIPREGSVDLETLVDLRMEGECSNFPYDYSKPCDSKPYTNIINKDLEKEYNEDLDWVQLIE